MRRVEMKKLLTSVSPAFFFIFSIFVYGPFVIYQGNIDEFSVPLGSILGTFILPALILFLVLSLLGLALSKKAHELYVSILFILGVLIWLQGNFLVWKYGLLDGQGIDWSKRAWRGWVDGIAWIVLLALTCLFFRKVYRIVAFGSVVITCLLLGSLAITSFQKPEIWARKGKSLERLIPPKEVFEFSSQQNIIHFILDGFRSDYFEEIVAGNMDHYSKSLEGFTFFKETSGLFPTTYMSVPAFLSGRIYKNNAPMREFVQRATRGRTVARSLHNQGYETDLISDLFFTKCYRFSTRYRIAIPYGGTIRQYLNTNSAFMLDLVLFRHVPHFLKKYIYNDERWLIQRQFGTKTSHLNLRYFSHQAFLNDLVKRLSVNRTKPVYKYIHLMTTHPPVLVDRECQYSQGIPGTQDNLKIQDKCSLDHFIEFLDELRSKGLYDSSLIVLQADHGLTSKVNMKNKDKLGKELSLIGEVSLSEIAGAAAALLAIKPPFSEGPLKISRAQVALTDIPETITSLLNLNKGFEGRSVYDVDENEVRERKFYFYNWRNENWQSTYFPRLDEFVIKGSLFDGNSWQWSRSYYPPTQSNR